MKHVFVVLFFFLVSPSGLPAQTPAASTCAGTGTLTREQWNDVPGTTVANIPLTTAPSSSGPLSQFEATTTSSFNYGARLRGYLCPPTSGAYTFWLTGDDAAELYLSPDADPAHRVRLLSNNTWTSGPRDYDRYASQKSALIQLQAGQRYYIEALHKQEWGPGYVSVAWLVPGSTTRQDPIPGANLLPFTPITDPVDPNKVRVTFTFAAVPDPARTTVGAAPVLYNKSRVLQYEEDDSPESIYTTAFPLFKSFSFTDGAGNYRPYTAAVAINGHNAKSPAVEVLQDGAGLEWPQVQTLLDNGWDVENHSDLHTADNPAKQIADLDALMTLRLKGFQPTVHIVPQDYAGYVTAAFAAGYQAVSSAGKSDGQPLRPLYREDLRIALSSLPPPTTDFVYRRFNADRGRNPDQTFSETLEAQLKRLQDLSTALLAPASPGDAPDEVYLHRVFSHGAYGINGDVLTKWLTYTRDLAGDKLWVTTLREFADYRRVSSQVIKPPTFAGNTLTVDLDYTALSAHTRFQSLTLLVKSSTTITDITVTGAASSSDKASGLVNILRTPSSTVTPPGSGDCTGTGTLTREQWNDVPGTTVADIPLSTPPTSSEPLSQFEAATTTSFNYGARLRGYLCPPTSGAYTFWLTGDDAAELYLSPDADPVHKQRIATCSSWTSGSRDFDRYESQKSAPVQLVAGQRYYIEALHKQEWGPGYVSVAWQVPGTTARQEPIPGTSLLPFTPLTATRSSNPATPLSTSVRWTSGAELRVYPNPFSRQATVQFRVPTSGPATVALYDLQGRLVRELFAGSLTAGQAHTISLEGPALVPGLYLVRLRTARGVLTHKLSFSGH